MYNKKAALPVLEVISIMLFSSFILIFFMIQLFSVSNYDIDQGKLKQQIILDSFLNSKCLLKSKVINSYALFEKEEITTQNLEKCFLKNEGTYIKLNFFKNNTLISNIDQPFFPQTDNDEFMKEKRFCSYSQTNFCSDLILPIRYYNKGNYSIGYIQVEIITSR